MEASKQVGPRGSSGDGHRAGSPHDADRPAYCSLREACYHQPGFARWDAPTPKSGTMSPLWTISFRPVSWQGDCTCSRAYISELEVRGMLGRVQALAAAVTLTTRASS